MDIESSFKALAKSIAAGDMGEASLTLDRVAADLRDIALDLRGRHGDSLIDLPEHVAIGRAEARVAARRGFTDLQIASL